MSCNFVCDSCGKVEKAAVHERVYFKKPNTWFQRGENQEIKTVCSKECAEKLNEALQEFIPIKPEGL